MQHRLSRTEEQPAGLVRLYLGSGVPDGYYFDVGRRIAQVLSLPQPDEPACMKGKECKIHVSDLSTRGSIDNVNCALQGKVDLFLSQTDIVQTLLKHVKGVYKINPKPLLLIYTEVVTVIARADIGAETIEDLTGLEICLPMKGSGSHYNARQILKAFGIKFKDTKPKGMHYSDCMLAIEDGRFDAMIYTIKHPHEPLLRFSQQTSKPMRFLSIPHTPSIDVAKKFELTTSGECGLRLMFATDANPEYEIIRKFTKKLKLRKRECVVLVVRAASHSEKWTIAGFNDVGEFCSVRIDDPGHELAQELNQEPKDERRIVELASLSLGRTHEKLTACQDAIDIGQYPQIVRWMESKDLRRGTKPVSSYCTHAALFHTSSVKKSVLEVLGHRLRKFGYRRLVPPHLHEQSFAEKTVTEQCDVL